MKIYEIENEAWGQSIEPFLTWTWLANWNLAGHCNSIDLALTRWVHLKKYVCIHTCVCAESLIVLDNAIRPMTWVARYARMVIWHQNSIDFCWQLPKFWGPQHKNLVFVHECMLSTIAQVCKYRAGIAVINNSQIQAWPAFTIQVLQWLAYKLW